MAFRDPSYQSLEVAQAQLKKLNEEFYKSVPANQQPTADGRGFQSPYTVYARSEPTENGEKWSISQNKWMESEFNRSPGDDMQVHHSSDARAPRDVTTSIFNNNLMRDATQYGYDNLGKASEKAYSGISSMLNDALARIRYNYKK